MLALKSIFAQSDRISVLVFDEIDANIGGRMGTVIGQKLRRLARDGGQQVLCITHLPQIAAFADRHLRIAKAVTGKGKSRRTATSVEPLDGQSRIAELAEMLAGSGASATTQEQAREMLAAAGG
jgi:DNA repair protein RecN (Recombination protein N)